MLAGKEVCVINGSAAHPKSDLEKKVVEFGGTIVQNPGKRIISTEFLRLETPKTLNTFP